MRTLPPASLIVLPVLVLLPTCGEPPLETPVETHQQAAVTLQPAIDFTARPSYLANNVIALTFDDGPELTNTPLVLDTLKAKNVKASFFINTDNFPPPVDGSAEQKALIQRIVNEGHVLGSHTVHHPHLPDLDATTIEAEITGVETTVHRTDVLGPSYPKLTLLRAPYGEPYQAEGPGQPNYDKVAPIVGKYAVHVGWAIDTVDWSCTTGTAAQNRQCVIDSFTNAVKTVGTGDYGVVLMHSVQPQTAAAIGAIIDYCVSHNFVFKTAEEVVVAKFGKSSNEIIYGCTEAPFNGTHTMPGTVQAEDYDSGGQNCAYFDTTTANQGGAYRTSEAVDVQATTDTGGGFNVGFVAANEYLKYTVNVASAGNYKLELRVAATATGKSVDVFMGNTLIADNLAVPNTGAFQTFTTISVPSVALSAGTQVLKVLFNTSSINLNWIKLTALSSSSNIFFEAENGTGASTAPMTIVNDANASGGKCIWSGTSGSNASVPTNGHVTFAFTAPSAGTYKVWGRFLVGPATTSDDSLWVRIDSGTWVQWNDIFPRIGNAGYAWDSEHDTPNANAVVTHTLTAGAHVLEVAYRESGLKMDRFLVTNDLSFVP
jgi:peptidoglycan/xylan/chitin deacetylase (PgdA/CDA1 family)